MESTGLPRLARILALVAAAAIGAQAGVKQLFPTAIFTFDNHPDLPLRQYAEGRLGIVQPSYARSYLYVAYRWMDGAPMTPEEVEQLDAYWQDRLRPGQPDTGAAAAYDAIRGSIDIPWQAPERPNSYAAAQQLGVNYVYYSKCSDDAFSTAATTLQARIDAFGKDSREVAEWIRGQDYVFENCFGAGSGYVPPRAPSDVDPLIQADRAYQTAAALFYSSRYQEAASAFRRIAADSASPWSSWGRYLAGRSLLWYARASGELTANYRGRLALAEAELRRAIEADGPAEPRDAARWLLARILVRTDPLEAATLLSGRLLSPLGSPVRSRELGLFTQLMDNLEENPEALAEARAQVELVDWIFTFQRGEQAAAHAVERWREEQSVAWLVAALASVGPFDDAALDLLGAAAQVQGHPASSTIGYYRARLHVERGEQQQAIEALEGLGPDLQGLRSSGNRALAMRASLGRGPEEMLFFGVRPPAFVSYVYWGDGSYLNPWRLGEEYEAELERFENTMLWGPETAEILNGAVTVDALVPMLNVEGQPAKLWTELLLAAWTRSVLLQRWDFVRAMAARVGKSVPSMRADMESLLAVTAPDRMRYFAASALLKTPGASVLLHSGPLRAASLDQVDPKGLNWWVAPPPSELIDYLPPDERGYVAAEWDRIRAAGDAYPWLVEEAIAEAGRPDPHPSAPETLYRAVTVLDGVDLEWGRHYLSRADARELRSRAVEAMQRYFSGSEWTAKAIAALEAR